MELVRQYRNAAGDDLRIDSIIMERRQVTSVSKATGHTFARQLSTRSVYNTSVSDRVVAEIEIIGDFNDIDGSAYSWASWNSPSTKCDMSDLPFIGDTV